MEYGQTSKELEYDEENEETVEPKIKRKYHGSILPHFRFDVHLPNSMAGARDLDISNRIQPARIHDSSPYTSDLLSTKPVKTKPMLSLNHNSLDLLKKKRI